jgi:diguanylate cyclase (GGDEF)-like protein
LGIQVLRGAADTGLSDGFGLTTGDTMQKPAKPENEATRIETLRALNILDSSPEERFDRLTRLAKRLFNVPIALVSLVDENRQWFKSCQGLAASETPRDISFCGHAILGDDVFLIPDAAQDNRFFDNPLVTEEPHIRFYAGCPLVVGDGNKLGTLCLIDREPRRLDEEDLALLRDLARMAEQELAALQLATLDELTMISNRRGFEALAQHAISMCIRKDESASLMYFDLDHFKPINDRFGHAEGDRALRDFARLLQQTFRESDVIGRIGGDEFAVFATGAVDEGLASALGRLHAAVAEFNREGQRGYDLAYSVGAVAFDATQHRAVGDIMKAADTLMYQHKQQRRSGAEGPAAASGQVPAAG